MEGAKAVQVMVALAGSPPNPCEAALGVGFGTGPVLRASAPAFPKAAAIRLRPGLLFK